MESATECFIAVSLLAFYLFPSNLSPPRLLSDLWSLQEVSKSTKARLDSMDAKTKQDLQNPRLRTLDDEEARMHMKEANLATHFLQCPNIESQLELQLASLHEDLNWIFGVARTATVPPIPVIVALCKRQIMKDKRRVEASDSEIASLREQLDQLRKQLEMEKSNTKAETTVSNTLRCEMEKHKAETKIWKTDSEQQLNAERKKAQKQIQDFESLNKKFAEMQQSKAFLETEVASLQREKRRLFATISASNDTIAELQQSSALLQSQHDKYEKQTSNTIAALKKSLQAVTIESSEKEAKMQKIIEEKEKEKLRRYETETASVNERNKLLKVHSEEIQEFEGKLTLLKSDNEQLERHNKDISAQLESSAYQFQAEVGLKRSFEQLIANLTEETRAKTKTIKDMESQLSLLQRQESKQNEEFKAISVTLAQKESALLHLQRTTASLNVSEKPALELECIVCLDKPKQILLMPCKHWGLCVDCSETCRKCPVCCKDISEKIQPFIV